MSSNSVNASQHWTDGELKLLLKSANKHTITNADGVSHPRILWESVSADFAAKGFSRSAGAIRAHAKKDGIQPGVSQGGGSNSPTLPGNRWREDELELLKETCDNLLKVKGTKKIDWDQVCTAMAAAGYHRSSESIKTHYRELEKEKHTN